MVVACLVRGRDTARATVSRVWGLLMASRRHNVVVVMLDIAQDLEERNYGMAGVLRQLAREVSQLAFDEPSEVGRCGCGAVIVQPRTGRPRKFCLVCSPKRKSPAKRDDSREGTTNQGRTAA